MLRESVIENFHDLVSHGNTFGRRVVAEVLEEGLKMADPYNNVRKLVRVEGRKLIVGCREFEPSGDPRSGDEVFDLDEVGDIYVVGAAKGVQRAAKALEDILGDRLTGGHVIAKKGDELILKKIGVTFGAHPVPDEDCIRGAQKIYDIVTSVRERDVVFTISGNGGSSLLTLPVPGVSLDDVRDVTYKMQVGKGASTGDLNAVRNHLDMLKVGRMSLLMKDAYQIHILLWDADDPSFPDSGTSGFERLMKSNRWLHALPDCTTFEDAVRVLKKWSLWERVPESVRAHLLRADPKFETPKWDDFKNIRFRVFGILPRRGPILAAKRKAESLGFNAVILTEWLHAEAREAGRIIAQIAKSIENSGTPFTPPCVLLTTGELIVTVGENRGIGGRNQEFALSAALEIRGSSRIVVGAVDTDGTDGPGNQFVKEYRNFRCLAGGIVDGYTAEVAEEQGIDILQELRQHNSSIPLIKLKDGVIARQGVSLNDLGVTLILK